MGNQGSMWVLGSGELATSGLQAVGPENRAFSSCLISEI